MEAAQDISTDLLTTSVIPACATMTRASGAKVRWLKEISKLNGRSGRMSSTASWPAAPWGSAMASITRPMKHWEICTLSDLPPYMTVTHTLKKPIVLCTTVDVYVSTTEKVQANNTSCRAATKSLALG